MPSSFKIGKIGGIEIGVHWSWILIFALITFSFSDGILEEWVPGWSASRRWLMGAIAAGIFFASILLHELSHSWVARAHGIPVKGITLFIFGGVSNLEREAQSAGEEFQIAIVGPLTSLLLGALFAVLWLILRGPAPDHSVIAAYLAFFNAVIAAFNMLPGFPLDGGRVFRSIVWARNRNLLRATGIASRVGQYVAFALMGVGVLQMLILQNLLGGVWMIFIGIFLRNASSASYEQMVLESTLRGVTAGEIARTDFVPAPPDMPIAQLVSDHMLSGHGRCYPVLAGQELLGLISLRDVQKLDREHWPSTSVYRAMTPFEKLHTVSADESAARLLQMMGEADVNQVPVVDGRLLLGLVSRADIVHLIQVRRSVGADT